MVELLAPAGNFDALRAAVEAGADAVYLAGEKFGARAYAENFAGDNLLRAVDFAHLRGVKVHVAVNTLIADKELDDFANYIKFLRRAHVDALLVQDLGAAAVAKSIAPEIPLHASTQMTVHNSEGVKALADFGFSRVVLSRELSLREIESVCRAATIETEIFVHGSLCICWSGQCLMSSLIGGRSGNRGRCSQPCRLPYKIFVATKKKFLDIAGDFPLSAKDISQLEVIWKTARTGVTSFKIEGRMKSPEYVAAVVKVYRNALDTNRSSDVDRRILASFFSRGFTHAFLVRNPGKNLISIAKPNNRGVAVGRVSAVNTHSVTIKLTGDIAKGDQLEFWVKVGGRVSCSVNEFVLNGDLCTINASLRGVHVHDRVFKVFDANLTAWARMFFTGKPVRKIPVNAHVTGFIGEPVTLTLTDSVGNISTARTNFIAERAKNRPLTSDTIQKHIARMGNSVFALHNFSADIDQNLMIPVSALNDIRRRAVEPLKTLRLNMFARENLPATPIKIFPPCSVQATKIVAHVDSKQNLIAALDAGADEILAPNIDFAVITHRRGKFFALATPRIIREDHFHSLNNILSADADAVYVHNIATLRFLKNSAAAAQIRTDFSLHVFNRATINFLCGQGVAGVTLSPELNLAQVKALAKNSPLPVECIVHGRQELMISAYCVLGSFLGDVDKKNCPHVCRTGKFLLRDRLGEFFPIVCDEFCQMHILNSKTLSMIEHRTEFDGVARIRVDCRFLSAEETARVIRAYKFGGAEIENFTRGHYFRGVT